MRAIKKISMTPISEASGSIIDNDTSTVDKHTNTYSMNIIDGFKMYHITAVGYLTQLGSMVENIDYPDGIDSTNCLVVSVMVSEYFAEEYNKIMYGGLIHLYGDHITLDGYNGRQEHGICDIDIYLMKRII